MSKTGETTSWIFRSSHGAISLQTQNCVGLEANTMFLVPCIVQVNLKQETKHDSIY